MGQPLVIRRRFGLMSDMRDQRLRGVKLNWYLAHITHPHTRHPSLITVATKQTFRRFITLSLPHKTPTSHLLTPSQPHNNPPLLSRLLPLSSRLLNREPRFLLPEVRGCGFTQEGAWPHKTCCHGGETQSRIVSMYVLYTHLLLNSKIINTTSHYQQYCFNYTYTLFL